MPCGKRPLCEKKTPFYRQATQTGSGTSLEQEQSSEDLKARLQESSRLLGRAWERGDRGRDREGCPPCREGQHVAWSDCTDTWDRQSSRFYI